MTPLDRRLFVRKTPKHIGYLSLPRDNGGFVIDISEGGLGFQAVAPLNAAGPIQIRFAIDSAERIRVFAELAWIDETRKAGGLRFLKLPDEARARIREWIGLPEESAEDVRASELAPKPVAESDANPEVVTDAKLTVATEEEPGELRPGSAAEEVVASTFDPRLVPDNPSAVEDFETPADSALEPDRGSLGEPVVESPAEPQEFACNDTANATGDEFVLLSEPAAHEDAIPLVDAELLAETDLMPTLAQSEAPFPNFELPLYGGTTGQFSMFATDVDEKPGTETLTIGKSSPLTKRHPLAALGLTIVLAFLASIPISAYVSTSRAGDYLFAWSQKIMWRSPVSKTIPQESGSTASPASDSAKLPSP